MKKNTFIYALLILSLCLSSLAGAPTPSASSAPLHADKISPWVLEATAGGAQADFLVVLSDQADLSAARNLPTKQAKGRFVYDTLWETAQRSQAPLRAWLDAQGVPYRSFYIVNLIHVQAGDRALVEALAARPDVARIEANPKISNFLPPTPNLQFPTFNFQLLTSAPPSPTTIEPNIVYVHAPEVWAMGFTGQGIVVGGQDTGYQWDHPALKPHYRGWDGSAADHDYNWHDSIHSGGGVCGADSPTPCDDYGHGTHTMGTAVGSDGGSNQIGMAPGARWIGCRNMDQGTGTPATYLECFEFFLAPYPVDGDPGQGNPGLAPDVTNNSWGCPTTEGCSANTLLQAVDAQRAAGIMTVVSAGNSGSSCSTVTDPPAIYAASYVVGALTTGTDGIAGFSSRGPVTVDGSNRRKPDISAPGTNIRSSVPGSGYEGGWSGTSMAGPHVAGAAALLWSAVPGLTNDIAATEAYLSNNAYHISSTECSSGGVPNNVYGWGRLDIQAAVEAAIGDAGVLTGYVTEAVASEAPGDPIADADLWASRSPTITAHLTSDANGLYRAYMPSAAYTLTVAADGYYSRTIPDVVVEAGLTATLDITLTALPRYVVAGTVTEAGTGSPLPATVSVVGNPVPPVSTDPASGVYSLTLQAGVYTLAAESLAHVSQSRVITVTGPITEDFALTPICVLVVDDDAGQGYQNYYTRTLNNLGVGYDLYTVPAGADGPSLATLSGYEGVVWLTGNDGSTTLKANDQSRLASYLDNAGRLFLSGQDIAYNIKSSAFLTDYLHTHFLVDDANKFDLTGLDFMTGRNLVIQGGDGANNQTWPDGVAPANGGVAVYDYATLPPDSYGAIAYDGDYRTVFFSFGYEAINNQADRDAVMEAVLGHLEVCGLTPPSVLPIPSFASNSPNLIGTTTMFTNTTVVGTQPITYTWSFGDSTPAMLQPAGQMTVTHAYTQVGQYTAWLTATNKAGTAAVSEVVNVIGAAPQARFVSSSPVEVGQAMTFTNTTVIGVPAQTSYQWSFGDGAGYSTETSPVYTYTQVGTYTVWLTATNLAGGDVFSDTVHIEAMPNNLFEIYLPLVLK